MKGIDAVLASLPPWTLVGGKGGVGKTTCAASLAARSAAQGIQTLVLSTDPAGALADVLGTPLTGEPTPVRERASLFAMQLDAPAARNAFVARWGDMITTIVDRGTYLDRDDVRGLVDAALPGIDETMAVLALADLAERSEWKRVVLDTAPTGHTLRLLALPDAFRALVKLLDTMQAKHRFTVSALLHRYRPDDADAFILDLQAKLTRLHTLLTDGDRTAVVLVARPEPVVVAETVRYGAALTTLGMTVRLVVMNTQPQSLTAAGQSATNTIRQSFPDIPVFAVPELAPLDPGVSGIDRWSGQVHRLAPARQSGRERLRSTGRGGGAPPVRLTGASSAVGSLPPVLIVGGKGGVGKTSVSCALALASARDGHRTILVSTDPAPSIGDALDQRIEDADTLVTGGFGLRARQIDAGAAFARWRSEYQSRVDTAFDGLLGPGLDASHDRAIARELFALAPPGIDELYALIWLGDALAEGLFARIVIDPAPTGHLIRLLEMPALALDWSHRLLRLMLKYRELGGGGELGAELLAFARRTRSVGELLRDRDRAGVLVVALDEAIVRLETERVVGRIRSLGDHVPAIIWNRAREMPRPLPVEPPIRQFVAAEVSPPPVGPTRLLGWLEEWRALGRDG